MHGEIINHGLEISYAINLIYLSFRYICACTNVWLPDIVFYFELVILAEHGLEFHFGTDPVTHEFTRAFDSVQASSTSNLKL